LGAVAAELGDAETTLRVFEQPKFAETNRVLVRSWVAEAREKLRRQEKEEY